MLPYICVSSKRRRRRHAFLEYVFDSGRRAARYRVPIHLNGRRPRGRGGRVGRVWRTTVVHRTHSVNSYVAVLHALYASGAGPAPGRADVACVYRLPRLCVGYLCVAAGSDFGHVRYCNGHLRDGHLRTYTDCVCASVGPRGRLTTSVEREPPCRS